MKTMRHPTAKILSHASGLGTPSPDLVRERALELARIDGRKDFNDEDWQHAKAELHGGHPMLWSNGDDEMAATVSERDMIVFDAGHHVENISFDDSENAVEELIAEGMDEAMHDRMLAASHLDEEEV